MENEDVSNIPQAHEGFLVVDRDRFPGAVPARSYKRERVMRHK
jgi:hypothetical protein